MCTLFSIKTSKLYILSVIFFLTFLTFSHLQMHSDANEAEHFRNHCGKRNNCSSWAISLFATMFQLLLNILSFIEFVPLFWQGMWKLHASAAVDLCKILTKRRNFSSSVLFSLPAMFWTIFNNVTFFYEWFSIVSHICFLIRCFNVVVTGKRWFLCFYFILSYYI